MVRLPDGSRRLSAERRPDSPRRRGFFGGRLLSGVAAFLLKLFDRGRAIVLLLLLFFLLLFRCLLDRIRKENGRERGKVLSISPNMKAGGGVGSLVQRRLHTIVLQYVVIALPMMFVDQGATGYFT